MRTILALGLLVALSAPASAGTVQHKQHRQAAPVTQEFVPPGYTPRAAAGFAYVPSAAPYSAPTGYGDPYQSQHWGG